MENQPQQAQRILVVNQKTVGTAILLSLFFGPLGMLYSTVIGGVVMFLVNLVVGIVTLGIGLLLTWPLCVIWSVLAVNSHNKKQIPQ